jgi:hypothetical protein
VSVLAISAAAVVGGARSLTAIGEWAADAPQDVPAKLGAGWHRRSGRYIAPHEATIRRALALVDADALDTAIGSWLDAFEAQDPAGVVSSPSMARPCVARVIRTVKACIS